jgi:hypothetical protein
MDLWEKTENNDKVTISNPLSSSLYTSISSSGDRQKGCTIYRKNIF